MTELQIMMQGMSEEQRERIHKQADRLEVHFNNNGDIYMKDKDEGWDGVLPSSDAKVKLPKGDARTG